MIEVENDPQLLIVHVTYIYRIFILSSGSIYVVSA
jgi:hypothetical protein